MPTPRTWVAAETVNASLMNAEIRDMLNYLIGTTVEAQVLTAQTTASTTYTDLTTAGPTASGVSLAVGQPVLVIVSARISNNAAGLAESFMSFAVSGAETDAASDDDAASNVTSNGVPDAIISRPAIYVPGTAGSHTFTAKYKVSGSTGSFRNRKIVVMTR